MLHSISWKQYCTALTILLIVYYGYVCRNYFRQDIFRKRNETAPTENEDDAMLPVVRSLNDEISAYIQQAAHSHAVKPEILFALQRIIQKYPTLKDTPYRNAVNRLLQLECHDQCALRLDDAELNQVWMV